MQVCMHAPSALARVRRLPAVWRWCVYALRCLPAARAYRRHDSSNNRLYTYVYISIRWFTCLQVMSSHVCRARLRALFDGFLVAALTSLQLTHFISVQMSKLFVRLPMQCCRIVDMSVALRVGQSDETD